MNTRILEYVLTVAEEKQQASAAEKLMISPPALSMQLKRLEKDLGAKLFYKKGNSLLLTDAGKIYVNGAQFALNIYYGAVSDIQKIRTRKKQQLTLIYNNVLTPSMSDIVSKYTMKYPSRYISTINGNANTAIEYLMNGIADLAIIATWDFTNNLLEFIPLRDAELELALPLDHPCLEIFQKSGVNFDLLNNDHFILDHGDSYINNFIHTIFEAHQFSPKSSYEISDLNITRNMVINHQGIAFLPADMNDKHLYAGFPLKPRAVYHISVVYRKDIFPGESMNYLISLLKKNI